MASALISSLSSAMALGGCAGHQEAIQASQRFEAQVSWPPEYEPRDATFFVHNEIEVAAPPEAVWPLLMDAEAWPEWYRGAHDVKLQGGKTRLEDGAAFTWTTMGLDFVSTVKELVPNRRLSWESEKAVIKGYHAWLIIPTAQGCRVITDESQHGFLAHLEKVFQPNKLRRLHDEWLAQIKAKAEAAHAEAMAAGGTGETARR